MKKILLGGAIFASVAVAFAATTKDNHRDTPVRNEACAFAENPYATDTVPRQKNDTLKQRRPMTDSTRPRRDTPPAQAPRQ